MRVLIIPDSFKGTLSSIEVCNIIEDCLRQYNPKIDIVKIPIADGGEGTVDTMLAACGGEKIYVDVTGPYFEPIHSFFGLIDQGKTAIIEMAACAGLPLVFDKKNPSITTTYGVGKLIEHALDLGVSKIIVGLGGSATNDAGVGCASALGIKFFNQNHNPFVPVGETLHLIKHIDSSGIDQRLKNVHLVTMCDIDNPLYGSNGAAAIFGPQKGADSKMIAMLDQNLMSLSNVVSKDINFDDPYFPGAGSAGGMGYGMKVFLNSKIQMGINTILDQINFEKMIDNIDLIITGEGQLDLQSLRGKVVIGIARKAKMANVKTIAIVGNLIGSKSQFLDEGLLDILITNKENKPFNEVIKSAEKDLRLATYEMIHKHIKSLI